MIPAGTVVFATEACDEGMAEARAHIKQMAWTRDDVRLIKRGDQVLIILERDLA